MQWIRRMGSLMAWRRQRASAWGALLGQQDILVAALSVQQTGGIRVVVFEHLHAPAGLVHLSERDEGLVQALGQLGQQLPKRSRTMALAVGEERCRQGVLAWEGALESRRLEAAVQLEAAAAWGVEPMEVGFDFRMQQSVPAEGLQVQWASCLREQLLQWQHHARRAGWRLPVVEPELQAAQRAAVCLRGDALQHWAQSPQDWQFARVPARDLAEVDWPHLQSGPMWKSLVACGAALGALL